MLLYPLWFIDVISNIPHTQQNKSRRTEDKDPGCLLQMMRNRKPWDSSHSNRTEGFVQSQSVRYNKNSSVQIDVVTLKKTHISNNKDILHPHFLEKFVFPNSSEERSLQGLIYRLGTRGCDIHLRRRFERSVQLSCINSAGFANCLAVE